MNTSTNPAAKTRKRIQIHFDGAGRTKQTFKDECDINKIMEKYQTTGAISHVANTQNNYGFADSITFTESMQIVSEGNRMFLELPSSIRSKFRHDPAEFLAYVQDPSNTAGMAELGLLSPEATKAHIVATKAAKALADEPPTVTNDEPIGNDNPGT